MKRNIALLLTVFMLLTIITACNQQTKNTQDSSSSNSTIPPQPSETKESMKISFVGWNCGDIVEDNFCESFLQDKFGIEITTKKIDLSQAQQVELMLASGEMPDCGWLGSPPNLFDQDIIREIPDSMIHKYAPKYTETLTKDPIGWYLFKSPKSDNAHIALTGYAPANGANLMFYMGAYRYDWLQKLGIKPNGEVIKITDSIYLATEPFVKSQFVDILDAFTNDDPDANGKNDTYGATVNGVITQTGWAGFTSIFGINTLETMEVNGKAEYYYVTPQYKEFLKFCADLYKKGYIEKEFPTITRAQSFEKIAANSVGYTSFAISEPGQGSQNTFDYVVPEIGGTVLYTTAQVNDDGTGGARCYSPTNFNYNFVVGKQVDDEKLAVILQMFDYVTGDEEGWLTMNYGIEGEHFEYGEVKDGVGYGYNLKEGVAWGGKYGIQVYSRFFTTQEQAERSWKYERRLLNPYFTSIFKKYILYPYRYDIEGKTNIKKLKEKYNATISTLVSEYFYNAICGSVNVDATWDDYINSLNKAGYSEYEAELQKAPLYSELVN